MSASDVRGRLRLTPFLLTLIGLLFAATATAQAPAAGETGYVEGRIVER